MKQHVFSLRSMTKISAALVVLLAASACTHEQLKQEADVAAIEDTAPTPDVADSGVSDPLVEPTPIPGDVSTPKRAHARPHHVSHPKKSSKHHTKVKKHKKHKTALAAAGRVDSGSTPTPPTSPELAPVAPTEEIAPVVPAAPVAEFATPESEGHGLMIALALLGLGGLAFAATRVRRARGSRRLVFN